MSPYGRLVFKNMSLLPLKQIKSAKLLKSLSNFQSLLYHRKKVCPNNKTCYKLNICRNLFK